MTLTVKAKGAGWVKWLRAEDIDHVLNRQVVVMPLPGDVNTGIPLAFAVDMGAMSQDIVIRGSIKDNDPLHAYGAASWRDLRHMVIRAWKDLTFGWSDPLNPTGSFRIGYYPYNASSWLPGGTLWYRCLPTRLELSRKGGQGYWSFSLTLAVVAWPPKHYEV